MYETEILVKQALASVLNYDDITVIEMNHYLRDDLHLDSMNAIMFLMKLEEDIDGFTVDPDTLQTDDLETVSSMVRYVSWQLNSKELDYLVH